MRLIMKPIRIVYRDIVNRGGRHLENCMQRLIELPWRKKVGGELDEISLTEKCVKSCSLLYDSLSFTAAGLVEWHEIRIANHGELVRPHIINRKPMFKSVSMIIFQVGRIAI